MDVVSALKLFLSGSDESRKQGELALNNCVNNNFSLAVVSLVQELANESQDSKVRQLAGLHLKNVLTCRSAERRRELMQKWMSLDEQTRGAVKQQVVIAFSSPNAEARKTAAWVCSTISIIELQNNSWVNIVEDLLSATLGDNVYTRESALSCLGYICEESYHHDNAATILQKKSDSILTAVVHGMKKEERNSDIRRFATKALLNSLEFIRGNMEMETERDYLMMVVCEATQKTTSPDVSVRETAMECLVKIANLYYDKLKPYIKAIYEVTFESVKKDEEPVAMQGIEFWSTVCEVELELEKDGKQTDKYVDMAKAQLINLLAECLLTHRTEDEDDGDEWNLSAAATNCLMLVSQTIKNDAVDCLQPFWNNFQVNDWKARDAATISFGCVMEGPTEDKMGPIIVHAMPLLLGQMQHAPNSVVKENTAWAIGRINSFFPQVVITSFLQQVLMALGSELTATSNTQVAAKCCWALTSLYDHWGSEHLGRTNIMTYELSPFFSNMVAAFLAIIDRDDAHKHNLRHSAYEALISLISSATEDCFEVIRGLIPLFLTRMTHFYNNPGKEGESILQGQLCGALQTITMKLGDQIRPFADEMMAHFLRTFTINTSSVHEESLMAVSAIATALKGDFDRYMPHFVPILHSGLQHYQQSDVCSIAVGCVSDLANALECKFANYFGDILNILFQALRSNELSREVKTDIIVTLSDVALNIGKEFETYLPMVMQVLEQAGKMDSDGDEDLIDYLHTLRMSIFTSYSGVLQGLKDTKPELFQNYIGQIIELLRLTSAPAKGVFGDLPPGLVKAAVECVGDICNVYGRNVKTLASLDSVRLLIEMSSRSNEETRRAGMWTHQQLIACQKE